MTQINNKVIFTICDCNYLKYGLTLAESYWMVEELNTRFSLVLVNYKNQFDVLARKEITTKLNLMKENLDIIWDDEIVPEQTRLTLFGKYNIIEYCTSIKALSFQYFFKGGNIKKGIYLDPDIKLYKKLDIIDVALNSSNIVLTPHINTADISLDFKETRESKFLQVGLYNLGFIGIRSSTESYRFLEWWNQRLLEVCYLNPIKGQFVDQNWINFVPVFFEQVEIIKDFGLNLAYWNYRERKGFLKESNDLSGATENKEIYFIHYSARNNLKAFEEFKNYLDEYEGSLAVMNDRLISMGLNFNIKGPSKDRILRIKNIRNTLKILTRQWVDLWN